MWSSQTAALLLLFAVGLSLSSSDTLPEDAFEFLDISDCLFIGCAEKIEACLELHGEDLTDQLKGCVVRSCRKDMIRCMDWIPKVFMATRRKQNMLSPQFQDQAETILEICVDSYLHCFILADLQNTTQDIECFLDNLLDRAEPYINSWIEFNGFSDSGSLMCYLRKALRLLISCSNDLDEDYSTELEENTAWEMVVNRREFMTCSVTSYAGKKCFQVFSRVFGSSPAMLSQTKGFFVCFINGLVVSTAAC